MSLPFIISSYVQFDVHLSLYTKQYIIICLK